MGLKLFNLLINTLGDEKVYELRIYSLNWKTTSNFMACSEEQHDSKNSGGFKNTMKDKHKILLLGIVNCAKAGWAVAVSPVLCKGCGN